MKQHDYQVAKNSEVLPYLSEIFGEIGDVPLFIKGINESQMAKILSRHHALDGNEIEAAVYLCDIGPGGGITKVHAGTKKFRYSP